jgi:hypothetical protein
VSELQAALLPQRRVAPPVGRTAPGAQRERRLPHVQRPAERGAARQEAAALRLGYEPVASDVRAQEPLLEEGVMMRPPTFAEWFESHGWTFDHDNMEQKQMGARE